MAYARYCLLVSLLIVSLSTFGQEIRWMSWEEAAVAMEKKPKKIFVDVYTNWCGWCKKMDSSTFTDPDIIHILNDKFYAVKLNAEQKDTIHWQGQDFIWVPNRRDGYNQLAFELLDGTLSYPSFISLDESYARIMISPGYKDAPTLLKELQFAGGDHYKTTNWEAFKARSN